MAKSHFWTAGLVLSACVTLNEQDAQDLELAGRAQQLANNQEQSNPLGASATYSVRGEVVTTGPFFQSLGSNGRRCVDCHQPDQGWTITPSRLALSFARSSGTDPVFRPIDGAVAPTANVATLAARRQAYKLLLGRGVIRVGLAVPEGGEFELVAVDDPAGFASAQQLSLFRRPLPAVNLVFQQTVMWDGRESPTGRSLTEALRQQAKDATSGHAEATTAPSDGVASAIVDFELGNFSAQVRDLEAGALFDLGAGMLGGPQVLAEGLSDNDSAGFALFPSSLGAEGARAAIARGQALFNDKARCTRCHDTPDVGTSQTVRFINLGISSPDLRRPDMPLYTFRNKQTAALLQTTDPGRALLTGLWADMDRFKVPSLRGLAARPPYFHNGHALTLADVVAFYDARFALGLSDQEKQDLAAFLEAL